MTLNSKNCWTMADTALKSEGSSGKSGSFFLASVDDRKSFFIKSIEPREKRGLQAMLKDYHEVLLTEPSLSRNLTLALALTRTRTLTQPSRTVNPTHERSL